MARPKKLTLDFFIHDSDASQDPKIDALQSRYGNDGWAFYFRMLETLCRQDHVRLSLKEDWEIESYAGRFKLRDGQHLIEIVAYAVRLGLFNKQLWESERIVFSDGLYKRYAARIEDRAKDAERQGKKQEAEKLSSHLQEFSGGKTQLSGDKSSQNSAPPRIIIHPENRVIRAENPGKLSYPPGEYIDLDLDQDLRKDLENPKKDSLKSFDQEKDFKTQEACDSGSPVGATASPPRVKAEKPRKKPKIEDPVLQHDPCAPIIAPDPPNFAPVPCDPPTCVESQGVDDSRALRGEIQAIYPGQAYETIIRGDTELRIVYPLGYVPPTDEEIRLQAERRARIKADALGKIKAAMAEQEARRLQAERDLSALRLRKAGGS